MKFRTPLILLIFFLIECKNSHKSISHNHSLPKMIKKSWKNTSVKTNNSKLRLSPYLNSTILELLPENTYISILDRSIKKQTIGKSSSFWYKIKMNNGIIGWTYGKNLKKEY